jgi:hypothetical protein
MSRNIATFRLIFRVVSWQQYSTGRTPVSRDEYEQQVAATRAALGEEAFAAA